MRKLLFLLLLTLGLSCSKDDECQEITGLSAVETNNGWKYTIELDHGNPIITNKATTDYYRKGGLGTCFGGYK